MVPATVPSDFQAVTSLSELTNGLVNRKYIVPLIERNVRRLGSFADPPSVTTLNVPVTVPSVRHSCQPFQLPLRKKPRMPLANRPVGGCQPESPRTLI